MKEKITKIVSVCLIIQFLCISLLPITEVKAAHIDGRNYYRDEVEYWTYIGTSSKVMRDIMIDSVGYDTFVQKTKYNYKCNTDYNNTMEENVIIPIYHSNTGLYGFHLPNNYFDIYKPRTWTNSYPKLEDDKYGSFDRIYKFDFSGCNLGDISVFPDFKLWSGTYHETGDSGWLELDFSNCGITDLSPFVYNINKYNRVSYKTTFNR